MSSRFSRGSFIVVANGGSCRGSFWAVKYVLEMLCTEYRKGAMNKKKIRQFCFHHRSRTNRNGSKSFCDPISPNFFFEKIFIFNFLLLKIFLLFSYANKLGDGDG
jgi:hypothetical protein